MLLFHTDTDDTLPTIDGDWNNKNIIIQQVALIVGLVVGITVILATIVVIASIIFIKWKKKNDYDLLD